MGNKDVVVTPDNSRRLLVVLPNWVGDVALATPTLRAIREHYSSAHIGYLMRPYVRDVLGPCNWCDETFFWGQSKSKAGKQDAFLRLARKLRQSKFEVAVLLTNSFRSALISRLAKIPHRVGYTRDGRSLLLTVKMLPDRIKGKYVPMPMVKYYGALGRYLGCAVDEDRLELAVRPEDQAAADSLLAWHQIQPDQPLAVINPGAAFGSAKCWLPERFAEVADQLHKQAGLRSFVVYGPGEEQIAGRIAQFARADSVVVPTQMISLGVLKGIMQRCQVLVTNDTGPRHIARAFGKPVVTIFGSTDPQWTDMNYPQERKVMVQVPCGPCMLKRCPLDHRCMQLVTADMVAGAVMDLLGPRREATHGAMA